MTKKDYVRVAVILREHREDVDNQSILPQWRLDREMENDWLIEQFAEMFKEENPRFDAERFRKAVIDDKA